MTEIFLSVMFRVMGICAGLASSALILVVDLAIINKLMTLGKK